MDHMERSERMSWVETAAVSAPALLGVAGGILLGDTMKRSARRPTALVLAGLGVAAIAPLMTELVLNQVKGPTTRRGREKTLQGIREGGGDLHLYDEHDEEVHVGI